MTSPTENEVQETKVSDKEINFRALEAKFQRQLEQERAARMEAERKAEEALARKQSQEDEEDLSDPYVDHKRLEKKLAKHEGKVLQQTQNEIQKAVQTALQEERKNMWLKQNSDFYDVLGHAEKLMQTDPELAEAILAMPDGFERQKLVYKNIKALGLNRPQVKEPSIQDKINANRSSPYYQPATVGSAPYAPIGDFSKAGQKSSYEKMQELKSRIRL